MDNCDVITKAYEISHTSDDGSMSINLLYNEEDLTQRAKDLALAENELTALSQRSKYGDNTEDTANEDYTSEEYTEYRYKMCQNILAFDNVMGDLVTNLKETNDIWDNTLIIFTSDNGAKFNGGGCNYPLRGTKGIYIYIY